MLQLFRCSTYTNYPNTYRHSFSNFKYPGKLYRCHVPDPPSWMQRKRAAIQRGFMLSLTRLLTCALLIELPVLLNSEFFQDTAFQNGSISGTSCCHGCKISFAEEGRWVRHRGNYLNFTCLLSIFLSMDSLIIIPFIRPTTAAKRSYSLSSFPIPS